MNKIIAKSGIFGLLILMTAGAYAVEEPYFGFGYSIFTLEADVPGSDNIDFDMDSFRLTTGTTVAQNFGFETRLIFQGNGDTISGITLEPEYIISFLANFNYPAGPMTLFLNAGYSFVEFEIDSIENLTFDEEGVSVGAGVDFNISNNLSIYADATSYLISHDTFDINSISAGIRLLIH